MAVHRSLSNRVWASLNGAGTHVGRYTLAAGLALSLAGVAPALGAEQTAPQGAPGITQPATHITHRDIQAFNRYLDRHPKMARELRKDPSLANDPNFLAKHPGLQKYLTKHPAVASTLKENPQALMKHEKRHAKKAAPSKA